MNVGLGWLGVCVGAVGCVVAYLMAGGGSTRSSPAETGAGPGRVNAFLCAGATLAVTLILWVVAMQTRVPFSPGQGLAFGILIGGLTGAVAILLTFRLFVDKVFAGFGESAHYSGLGLAKLQTGRVRDYAVGLLFGAVVLAAIVLWR